MITRVSLKRCHQVSTPYLGVRKYRQEITSSMDSLNRAKDMDDSVASTRQEWRRKNIPAVKSMITPALMSTSCMARSLSRRTAIIFFTASSVILRWSVIWIIWTTMNSGLPIPILVTHLPAKFTHWRMQAQYGGDKCQWFCRKRFLFVYQRWQRQRREVIAAQFLEHRWHGWSRFTDLVVTFS